MKDNNKPKEIDAIELDKFYLLVDDVIEKLEQSKKPKNLTEKTVKDIIENNEKSNINNNLNNLDIVGGNISDMMVVLFNEGTKQYINIYSNATICAKTIGLNPTTIRQRASANKVISNVRWSYMNKENYNNLISE